jgi:predicted anti-sigma-YlaC factor YlaD
MTRDDLKNRTIDYLAGKLTCKEVTEAITDYLEGNLSFVEWVRFQMHLGLCFGCRRYLRQMKLTIRTLGALPAEPLPPAVRDELIQRFRTWKIRERPH